MNLEPQPNETDSSAHTPQGLLTTGDPTSHPRLRLHRAFASAYLPDRRDLIVYVPPGYDEQLERSYPVLYLQDGQNLFDGRTSFIRGRTWALREQADAEKDELYKQIGQMKVELDFLKKRAGILS